MYREDSTPNRSVLVIALLGRVIGKDRATGATLWEHATGISTELELAVLEDRVFASSGREIFAIEYPSGRLLGRTPIPVQYGGRGTLLVDGHQLFAGVGGEIVCFDWNGALLWHDPLKGRGIAAMSIGLPGNVRQADRVH
jgi:outer membrane protein assembly factor BamB